MPVHFLSTNALSIITGETDYSNSSYTDTASTYYDEEEDDRSDATSCSSIATTYNDDDFTEATEYEDVLPTTSTKKHIKTTAKKSKAAKTIKTRLPKKQQAPKKRATKLAAKKTVGAAKTTPARPETSGTKKRAGRPKTTRVKKVRKPRAVAAKKAIALKRTPASVSINVMGQDASAVKQKKVTPPRQAAADRKLKPDSADKEITQEKDVPDQMEAKDATPVV